MHAFTVVHLCSYQHLKFVLVELTVSNVPLCVSMLPLCDANVALCGAMLIFRVANDAFCFHAAK